MQLGPEVRALLLQMGAGGVPMLEADGTPCIIAKLPITKRLTNVPIGYGQMEMQFYKPEGPVARMIFEVFDQPKNPLRFEAFINPSSPEDRRLMQRLTETETIHFHGFGAGRMLPYLGSKILQWKPEHRDGATELLMRTSNTTTIWPAAKERWMREQPL